MSNLPQLNQGLSSLRIPERPAERRFRDGLREIRLRDNGDVARFFFLDDAAITTHPFHETTQTYVTQAGKTVTFYPSRICLRQIDPTDGGDLDPVEVCPFCSSEDEAVQRRMLRMLGLVYHEMDLHRNKRTDTDQQAWIGAEQLFMTPVGEVALYLSKSKRTVANLKRFAAERGSLVKVMSFPDAFANPGIEMTPTVVEGQSQPFHVIKMVDRQTSYDIEARPPVPTPQALMDARANIPNLAEIVAKEYMAQPTLAEQEDLSAPTTTPASNLPTVSF